MDNKVKLEEIAKKIYPTHKGLTIVASNKTMLRRCAWVKGAEWQSERMYSEEEVCEFIKWINLHYRALEHTLSFKDVKNTKDLLKQFKKNNMDNKVKILANPQGIDVQTIGKTGIVLKRWFKFALIEFINEFDEAEEWYFQNNEFVNL